MVTWCSVSAEFRPPGRPILSLELWLGLFWECITTAQQDHASFAWDQSGRERELPSWIQGMTSCIANHGEALGCRENPNAEFSDAERLCVCEHI